MFSFSFYWTVAAVLFTLLIVVWTLFIWTLLVIVGWWPRGGAGMDVFRGSPLSSTVPLGSKFWLFLMCVCVCVGQTAGWLLCPHRWPFHCLLFYSCMCRLWVFSLLYNIRNCCISCLNNNIVILGRILCLPSFFHHCHLYLWTCSAQITLQLYLRKSQ